MSQVFFLNYTSILTPCTQFRIGLHPFTEARKASSCKGQNKFGTECQGHGNIEYMTLPRQTAGTLAAVRYSCSTAVPQQLLHKPVLNIATNSIFYLKIQQILQIYLIHFFKYLYYSILFKYRNIIKNNIISKSNMHFGLMCIYSKMIIKTLDLRKTVCRK